MPHATHRIGVLAAVAVTATTLALPISDAQAVPVTGSPVLVYVADTQGDGNHGLYSRTSASAAATPLVPPSATRDISEARTSADGSRIVTVEDDYATSHEQIVVRDVSGRLVRVVEDITVPDSQFVFAPTLSPDGSEVVWSRVSFPGGFDAAPVVSLRTAPVAAGAARTIAGGSDLVDASYLDATTLIAETTAGSAVTLPAAGGVTTGVAGGPSRASGFTVSPDGSQIAWSSDTTPDAASASTADIQIAPFTLAPDPSTSQLTATFGAPTTLATDLSNTGPAWSADGTSVTFVKNDGNGGLGDIYTVPTAGGTPVVDPTTPNDEIGVASGAVDTVAPAPATTNPFTLRGTGATLSWTLPGDADLSGVTITRTLAGAAPKSIQVPAPLTSYADTGLVLGKTYAYSIATVDRSGNTGTPVVRNLTALTAGATFANPTSATRTTPPFRVTFATGDPSSTLFTVDYRVNGGVFKSWVANQAGLSRPFGAASPGAAATTSTPGNSYAFRVTARDAYGNSTAPAVSGSAVVPYDQTKAVFSKAAGTVRSGDRWLGSVMVLKAAGATAKVTLLGNRFQVIGERCTTCGAFDVYSGSTRIGSIDTRAASRQVRAVLFTYTWKSLANRTLTIRARGTATRPSVILDGFAMWR
ncbi:MAG: N-acetylmuramoyl-L-alanine amidase family 2 [Frankiales bacterium]|nr:N-acetylmuramoyl-L-alanine amidase family 2 [Frankiales bacterium]